MRNLILAITATLAIAMTASSCKRQICTANQKITLPDSTVIEQGAQYDCNTMSPIGGGVGTGGGNVGGGTGGWNGGGGTPSTGGAPGTYTNPIQDLSVVHSGLYDFVVTDPSVATFKTNPKARAVLPDLNQDGALDQELGGIASHYGRITGVIMFNGMYYQVQAVVNMNNITNNIQQGVTIRSALMLSNKPFGYEGDPRAQVKDAQGRYFISPGAMRYYSRLML